MKNGHDNIDDLATKTFHQFLGLTNYQPLALRTEKPLPTPGARLLHAWLGIVTETGEVTTSLKRHIIYEKPMDAAMLENIAEEIGDVCWYLAIAFDALGAKMQLDEAFIPINWNRKAQHDKLLYSVVLLNNMAANTMVGLDVMANGGDDASKAEVQVRILSDMRQVLAALDLTCDALFGEGGLGRILAANISKLRERFPQAYSNDDAEARADKGGLSARES